MGNLADAVFEGGGVKGIGLVGALWKAEKLGYQWRYVAGTSAGAIVASLVAVGYSAQEIMQILENTDFLKFLDKGLCARLPYLGPLFSVEITNGIYKGDYFEEWIGNLLEAKGVKTFRDLKVKGAKKGKAIYKLRVIAADLSKEKLLVLPQDIQNYGMVPDELSVAKAIRMSMSIPFFYQPVKLNYFKNGQKQTSFIVDGGVLSNFPVWLFDDHDFKDTCPTFGFRLVEPVYGQEKNIRGPFTLMKALFSTMMEAHDQRYIEDAHFARSILIPTLGVRTTDFNISYQQQQALFNSGVHAADKFFGDWDYPVFLQKFSNLSDLWKRESERFGEINNHGGLVNVIIGRV